MSTSWIIAAAVVAAAGAACTQHSEPAERFFGSTPTAPSIQRSQSTSIVIQRVRVFVVDGQPHAFVERPQGEMCAILAPPIQQRAGRSIDLTLTATRTADVCAELIQELGIWVPLLDLAEPGPYTLRVNGVTYEFRLVRIEPDGLRVEPDPGPTPLFPTPGAVPGVVSPDDPAPGNQSPGTLPASPPAPR
jgi:hypothetical protein